MQASNQTNKNLNESIKTWQLLWMFSSISVWLFLPLIWHGSLLGAWSEVQIKIYKKKNLMALRYALFPFSISIYITENNYVWKITSICHFWQTKITCKNILGSRNILLLCTHFGQLLKPKFVLPLFTTKK